MCDLWTCESGQEIEYRDFNGNLVRTQVLAVNSGTVITITGEVFDDCNGDGKNVKIIDTKPKNIHRDQVAVGAIITARECGCDLSEFEQLLVE